MIVAKDGRWIGWRFKKDCLMEIDGSCSKVGVDGRSADLDEIRRIAENGDTVVTRVMLGLGLECRIVGGLQWEVKPSPASKCKVNPIVIQEKAAGMIGSCIALRGEKTNRSRFNIAGRPGVNNDWKLAWNGRCENAGSLRNRTASSIIAVDGGA